jgi:hypothetical protein
MHSAGRGRPLWERNKPSDGLKALRSAIDRERYRLVVFAFYFLFCDGPLAKRVLPACFRRDHIFRSARVNHDCITFITAEMHGRYADNAKRWTEVFTYWTKVQ